MTARPSQTQLLRDLLVELFSTQELRIFLTGRQGGEAILLAMPEPGGPAEAVYMGAARALLAGGEPDDALFDDLCDVREAKAERIRAAQAAIAATEPDPDPPTPDPDEPVLREPGLRWSEVVGLAGLGLATITYAAWDGARNTWRLWGLRDESLPAVRFGEAVEALARLPYLLIDQVGSLLGAGTLGATVTTRAGLGLCLLLVATLHPRVRPLADGATLLVLVLAAPLAFLYLNTIDPQLPCIRGAAAVCSGDAQAVGIALLEPVDVWRHATGGAAGTLGLTTMAAAYLAVRRAREGASRLGRGVAWGASVVAAGVVGMVLPAGAAVSRSPLTGSERAAASASGATADCRRWEVNRGGEAWIVSSLGCGVPTSEAFRLGDAGSNAAGGAARTTRIDVNHAGSQR